jgi:hypothetical protein
MLPLKASLLAVSPVATAAAVKGRGCPCHEVPGTGRRERLKIQAVSPLFGGFHAQNVVM